MDSSKIDGSNLIFSENYINNIFTLWNSSFSMSNLRYLNKNPNSFLLQANNSDISISSSYLAQTQKNLYSSIITSNFSNVSFNGVYLIGFSNKQSSFIMNDCNLTVKRSFLMGNKAGISGGCFSMNFSNELSNKNLIIFIKSLAIENIAFSEGGILYSISSNNRLISVINKNVAAFNKAYKGGSFYFENLENITVSANKFTGGQVFSNNDLLPSKGGVIFLRNTLQISDFPLIFTLKFNNFSSNKAQIGGGIFIQGYSLSFFNQQNNIFKENFGEFYGKDLASEINTIRFTTLERQLQQDTHKTLDSYYSASINGLKSGVNYTDCLLSITGFDRFNNLVYKTDEDFIQNLTFSQSYPEFYSISYTKLYHDGSICFTQQFIRNELPLDLEFRFQITSNLPLSHKEKFFYLGMQFSFCDVGQRLNYNLECSSCTRGTYSFQADFSSYTDSCKLCSSENFYCFGGGNFTSKPGYWRIAIDSYEFYRCPNPSACLGDPRDFEDPTTQYLEIYATGNCFTGYQGILCAECQDDFGYLDGHLCSSCQNSNYYLQIIGNILIRIIFTIYLVHISMNMCISLTNEDPNKNRIIATNLLKIFTNHIQIISIILNLPLSLPPQLSEGTFYLTDVSPSVSESFSVECILKSMNLNISLQYFKLLVSGIYPFIITLIYILFVKCLIKYHSRKPLSDSNANHIAISEPGMLSKKGLTQKDLFFTVFSLVALIGYADIAKMTLAMFGCVTIGDGKYNRNLLFSDFRIDCDGSYHSLWIKQAAAPILIFFLFLFPVFIVGSMSLKIRNKESDAKFNFRFGYFFYAYKVRFFFWDFIILLRKLMLLFMNAYFFSRVTDKIQNYPILVVMGMVSIAFILQIYCKPFKRENFGMINDIEEFSLVISFFSLAIALLYMIVDTSDGTSMLVLMIIAVIMNVSFFVSWLRQYYKYFLKTKILKMFTFMYFFICFLNSVKNFFFFLGGTRNRKKPHKSTRANL